MPHDAHARSMRCACRVMGCIRLCICAQPSTVVMTTRLRRARARRAVRSPASARIVAGRLSKLAARASSLRWLRPAMANVKLPGSLRPRYRAVRFPCRGCAQRPE